MIQKYPVSKTMAVAKTKIYLQKATYLMRFEELSMTMYTFDRKMNAYKTINASTLLFGYLSCFCCFGLFLTVFQRRTAFELLENTRDIVIVFESCVYCDVCQWAIGRKQ